MYVNKSIQSKQIGYLVILLILTALNFIDDSLLPRHSLLLLLILYIFLPVFYLVKKSWYKKIFFIFGASYFTYIAITALSFKKFRDLFSSKPQVNTDLLGFPQYYGYPLYLDTAIFFAVILFPVVFFFLMKFIKGSYLKN
jgi:hypothetical protein